LETPKRIAEEPLKCNEDHNLHLSNGYDGFSKIKEKICCPVIDLKILIGFEQKF